MVIIALHTYAILVTSQVAFFLNSCYYLGAFTEDFDQSMVKLNSFGDQSVINIQKRLSEAVKFNMKIVKFVLYRIK